MSTAARAAIDALMLAHGQRRDAASPQGALAGSPQPGGGTGISKAPVGFSVVTETKPDPSLGLRADAALASLGLFGFNPHQLCGPDGKWIKMPASQLRNKRNERARARRAAKKAEKQQAAPAGPWRDTDMPIADLLDVAMENRLDRNSPKIQALAEDIRKNGIKRRLQVEDSPKGMFLGDGHHRLIAAQEAGLTRVPVRIFDASPEGRRAANEAMRNDGDNDLLQVEPPAVESDEPDQAERAYRANRDAYNRKIAEAAVDQANDNDFDGVRDTELKDGILQLQKELERGDAKRADQMADRVRDWLDDQYEIDGLPDVPKKQAAPKSVEIDEVELRRKWQEALDDYNAEIHATGKAWLDMLRDPDVRNDPDSGLDHLSDAWINTFGHHVLALRKAILNGEGDKADHDADRIRAMLVGEQLQADHDFPHKPTLEELRNEALAQARGVPVPPSKTGSLLTSGAPISDRRAALEAAVAAGVGGDEPIGQGAMGETKKVVFNDGTRAIYKKAKGDWGGSVAGDPWTPKHQTDAEELASLVGSALGLRAPAVQRLSEDEINMELVEDAGPAMNRYFDRSAPDYVRVSDDVMGSDDALLMGLLDTLIDNPDRHGYNWMIDDAGRLYPIDHGLAFMNVRGTPGLFSSAGRSPFATEYFVNPTGNLKENILSRRDVRYLRDRLAPLEAEFERVGRPGWWRVMQMRLDAIEQRARGGTAHQLPAPREEQ